MSESEREYRLVIFSDDADPHLVRDLLAEELDLHGTDAMRLAAHAPGVIPHELDADKTRILVDRFTQAGIDAEGWLVDQLPDLSGPREIHKAQCLAGGLQTIGLRTEPEHWLPWSMIELVSVGVVPQAPTQRRIEPSAWLSATGRGLRPVAMGMRLPRAHPIQVHRPSLAELWIVRRRPVHALRVQQEQMNYEYLSARLQSSTAANFRLLVEDILRTTGHAAATPATQSYLVHERPGRHFFTSSQQLMEYTTWQLLLRWRSQQLDAAEEQ